MPQLSCSESERKKWGVHQLQSIDNLTFFSAKAKATNQFAKGLNHMHPVVLCRVVAVDGLCETATHIDQIVERYCWDATICNGDVGTQQPGICLWIVALNLRHSLQIVVFYNDEERLNSNSSSFFLKCVCVAAVKTERTATCVAHLMVTDSSVGWHKSVSVWFCIQSKHSLTHLSLK